ncbi:hypothetical protein CH375_13795 [Leptospira ellisii]|nr:hypothetical protein CH375_13795 [Leptospira ellisii]
MEFRPLFRKTAQDRALSRLRFASVRSNERPYSKSEGKGRNIVRESSLGTAFRVASISGAWELLTQNSAFRQFRLFFLDFGG